MAYPTLNLAIEPGPGTRKERRFRNHRIAYEDGLEQTAAAGINSARDRVTLVWPNISATDANSIEAYLNSFVGRDVFKWTYPGDTQKQWTCPQGPRRTETDQQLTTLTAEFVQDFSIEN